MYEKDNSTNRLTAAKYNKTHKQQYHFLVYNYYKQHSKLLHIVLQES